jgi:enoyl-CoA hydratase/carnithine racemase
MVNNVGNVLLSSSEGRVRLERKERVLFLVFDAPDSRNAIGLESAEFLDHLCAPSSTTGLPFIEELIAESQCGVLALKSTLPQIFVSGGDLKAISGFSKSDGHKFTQRMRNFCSMLRTVSIPTVSLLAGACYGGGCEIALATDFRWGLCEKASLNLAQTLWGVPGGWHGMKRLQEIVPHWDTRKIAFLFACAQSIHFNEMLHAQLLDKSYLQHECPSLSAEQDLQNIGAAYLNCDAQLRTDLLNRFPPRRYSEQERDAQDEKLFDKYWLSEEHLQKVNAFVERKKR